MFGGHAKLAGEFGALALRSQTESTLEIQYGSHI